MDIEKLIENAKVCCGDIETEDCSQYCIDPRDSRDSGLRWCRQWLIHDLHTALSTLQAENERLRAELEQVKKKNKYSAHDVALILSDVFGDSCACNFNGNDEWLPEKCELLDTCPDVVGVACWEQYLKWRGQKED